MVSSDEINRKLKNKREGTSDGNQCPACGSENPPGSKFCKECGTTLTDAEGTRSVTPAGSIGEGVDKSSTGMIGDESLMDDESGKKPFIRKIPGFRSHTTWKMFLSGFIYFLVILFIALLVIGSLLPSNPTILVSGVPVTLVNNNSSSTDGLMINATLKSNGSNITVLPVGVYSGGKYIGSFLMTNVSNQDVWFRINVNQNDTDVMSIKTSKGDDLTFYPEDNNTTSSYSLSPGDYKLIIGDSNVNMTTSILDDFLNPMITAYNKSKGSQSDTIKIQGQAVGDYSSTGPFPVNSNVTIFLKMDEGTINQGERVYEKSGDVVTAWQYYEDVLVIYWPEMKIAGWHRIKGGAVPTTGYGSGGDIYGDPVYSSNVTDWINSLPHA